MNRSTGDDGAPGPRLVQPRELVADAWSQPTGTSELTLCDPATGEQLQASPTSTPGQVDRALGSAWLTHTTTTDGIGDPRARAEALTRAAEHLDAAADQIAEQDAINSGVPIAVTRLFAGSLGGTFRAAARAVPTGPTDLSVDGRQVLLHRLPLGPAVVLAPWNAPTAVAGKKAAYAWAAGCPLIVKPSPWAPNGTTLMIEAMHAAATAVGLRPASVQLVFGGADVGQQLAQDPRTRVLSFTGSRAAGHAVAVAAANGMTATQLELGSNNPAVVMPDADIRVTAVHLAAGMTKLNGAWCESPGVAYVPDAVREHLIADLLVALRSLRFGHPLDPSTTLGPQSNLAQQHQVTDRLDRLRDAGARIITAGSDLPALPRNGYWTPPTLVIDPPRNLAVDEIFGPVLVIETCDQPEESVRRSHQLQTGLAGYVFGTDLADAMRIGRQLPVGEVKINGTSLLDMSNQSSQEFWHGSGVGGHGDLELANFFTGARIVGIDVPSDI